MDTKADTMIGEAKSVREVFQAKYFIPAYQRGYRWDEAQIMDLLNDLEWFYEKWIKWEGKEEALFYCMQAYTAVKNGEKWSVVDGQQRLTTMYLLLSVINKNQNQITVIQKDGTQVQLPCISIQDKIEYEVGKGDTKKYLTWRVTGMDADKPGTMNRDTHHMETVINKIENTFKDNKGIKEHITTLIYLDKVKFIPHLFQKTQGNTGAAITANGQQADQTVMDKKKEIDLFKSINTGKISLTDAELIRAKLLLAITQKHERQEIAVKWDEIEHSLQNNSFWMFLQNGTDISASRIGFLFELVVEDMIQVSQGKITFEGSGHGLYRYLLEHRYQDEKCRNIEEKDTFEEEKYAKNFWGKVEDYYGILYKMYLDVELYNYVGQIFFILGKYNFQKNLGISVHSIVEKYMEPDMTRSGFIRYLKSIILLSFDPDDIEGVWPESYFRPAVSGNQTAGNAGTSTAGGASAAAMQNTAGTGTAGQPDEDTRFRQLIKNAFDIEVAPQSREYPFYSTDYFRSLWFTGRPGKDTKDNLRRITCFLLWSNCELLNRQLRIYNRRKEADKKQQLMALSEEMYRFPFDIFKLEKADVEHIVAYNDLKELNKEYEELKKKKQNRELLQDIYEQLTEQQKGAVVDWLEKDMQKNGQKKCDYTTFLRALDAVAGSGQVPKGDEEKDPEDLLEDVRKAGNLSLLCPHINRAYGNLPFRLKRMKFVEEMQNGYYVYPCTKMVLLKEFSPDATDLFSWNVDDYKEYWSFLAKLFEDCFCMERKSDGTGVIYEETKKYIVLLASQEK